MTFSSARAALIEFAIWNWREFSALVEAAARAGGELIGALLGLVFLIGCWVLVYQVIVAIIVGGFT